MKNRKSTKRALFGSLVALLLCFSMLIGTTYAWFTDSVVSGSNVITAGNLDIDVEYTLDGSTWNNLDGATDLFQKDLWEPGHTEVVALRIKNTGTLALKYVANMNIVDEITGMTKNNSDIVLSEVLTVSTFAQDAINADGTVNQEADINLSRAFNNENGVAYENTTTFKAGNVLRNYVDLHPGAVHYLIVKVDMAETVGNEANHNGTNVPSINFGVNIFATQFTYEEDSFGPDYDKDAPSVNTETVIGGGATAGIGWTLTDAGTLTISPIAAPTPDANCGKVFAPGAWREAVIYNSQGVGVKIGYDDPNASGDEGGFFCDREAVTSLVIEEGVVSIGSFAAKFPNLTGEVVIPASVTYIGQEAFQNSPITKLTFAPGGTEALCIAPGAFKNMAIEEIVLPADRPAVHLHCWAFNDSPNLKNVTLPANITTFSGWTHVDYMGMNYANGSDSQIFARCNALEKITFGNQDVHDRFFAAPGNTKNINDIGGVEIVIAD